MICENCNKEHYGSYGSGRFCSLKCARGFSTKSKRKEINEKISKSLKGRPNPFKGIKKKKYSNIKVVKCKVCEKLFIRKNDSERQTCSRECQTVASTKLRTYQNGSRKTTWFFNPNENKKVLLESSWEVKVAKKLNEKKIKWVRPKHILWEDSNNKSHNYFPDFYLIDYNIYLDPKNPYCMKMDEEKMSVIEKKVNIIYGDLEKVLNYVDSL